MSTLTDAPLRTMATPPRADSVRTVIDDYLAEQQQLTAVETFSRWHTATTVPSQQRYYASLLPATAPGVDEQYAFEVDLDRCSGCKACVTACHALNGLDEHESFRDVGLLLGGTTQLPVIQHVTTACHHCLEPACAIACPVNAYEKSPTTGIVKHLDDQCFGCQYCTLACPYDVPKYHAEKGIVRKCDLCSDRLAVGEAPACVQACPHEAIAVRIVSIRQVVDDSLSQQFLPGAPEPQFTLPTTTYKTNRTFPRNLIPADYHTPKREHAHWSLIVMLVLTQLSVGAFVVELWLTSQLGLVLGRSTAVISSLGHVPSLTALALGVVALAAATLHLGRPLYAFRAVIGLSHSWLSREIVAFGVFAKLAALYATADWWLPWCGLSITSVKPWLGLSVAASGLLGVFCSVMIYDFTQRPFWNGIDTGLKFFGSTALLGLATVLATISVTPLVTGDATALELHAVTFVRLLAVLTVAKLLVELKILNTLRERVPSTQQRSAGLLVGALRPILMTRVVLGVVGGVGLPMLWLGAGSTATWLPAVLGIAVLVTLTAAELAERYLFFSAVIANRMPGGLTT
jgi:formate dehydrogenase iron-sulfur subunit